MTEDRVRLLVKQLDRPATPDPQFADALWARVESELRATRWTASPWARRGPIAVAVAAVVALVAAVVLPAGDDTGSEARVTTRPTVVDGPALQVDGPSPAPSLDGLSGSGAPDVGPAAGSTRRGERRPAADPKPSAAGPLDPLTGGGPSVVRGTDVVLFASDRDGTRGIWTMTLDGAGLRRIAGNPLTQQEFPDWSPDGRQIVFTEGRALVVVGLDGSRRREIRLPAGGRPVFPAWSPDGSMIAFQLEPETVCDDRMDCPGEVWVVRSDGEGARKVVTGHQPRWYPDGRRLVYVAVDQSCTSTAFDEIYWPPICYGDIEAVDLDGGEPESLAVSRGGSPSISPDGTTLLAEVILDVALGSDIAVVTLGSGRGWRTVASSAGDEYFPSWTPDGRIVYVRSAGRGSVLAVMNGDGSSKTNLQDSPSSSMNTLPRVARRAD